MNITTVQDLRAAVITWGTQQHQDPHVQTAMLLMAAFNGGRLLDDEMLAAFVVTTDYGLRWDWEAMDNALNGGESAHTMLPLSPGERTVARFACDLGMGRWHFGTLDCGTARLVAEALGSLTR